MKYLNHSLWLLTALYCSSCSDYLNEFPIKEAPPVESSEIIVPENFSFSMYKETTLNLEILNHNAKPYPNARIEIYDQIGSYVKSLNTDKDGRWQGELNLASEMT